MLSKRVQAVQRESDAAGEQGVSSWKSTEEGAMSVKLEGGVGVVSEGGAADAARMSIGQCEEVPHSQ